MDNQTLCILMLIIFCICCLAYLIFNIKKNGLRKTVIKLIVYAEEHFSSGKGSDKMNYVIEKFIAILPTPLRLVLTTEMVRKFIQSVFDEIQEALEYGNKIN